MFHDRAEHGRLQMLPLTFSFRDRNETGTEEYPSYTFDFEQPGGERRSKRRLLRVAKVARALLKDSPAGKKFQSRRVRRCLGLNEHGQPLRSRTNSLSL